MTLITQQPITTDLQREVLGIIKKYPNRNSEDWQNIIAGYDNKVLRNEVNQTIEWLINNEYVDRDMVTMALKARKV